MYMYQQQQEQQQPLSQDATRIMAEHLQHALAYVYDSSASEGEIRRLGQALVQERAENQALREQLAALRVSAYRVELEHVQQRGALMEQHGQQLSALAEQCQQQKDELASAVDAIRKAHGARKAANVALEAARAKHRMELAVAQQADAVLRTELAYSAKHVNELCDKNTALEQQSTKARQVAKQAVAKQVAMYRAICDLQQRLDGNQEITHEMRARWTEAATALNGAQLQVMQLRGALADAQQFLAEFVAIWEDTSVSPRVATKEQLMADVLLRIKREWIGF